MTAMRNMTSEEDKTDEKKVKGNDEKKTEDKNANGNDEKKSKEEKTAEGGTDGKKEPSALQKIKASVSEEDPKMSPSLNLRTILGGDILNADFVRGQLWLILLVVVFTIIYVAFRYQCQQDMLAIDKLERELKDAKYRALASSSSLTEKCRESHILEMLKNRNDSLLQISDQPPYIINVPEE